VFRGSTIARNLHRLCEIRDAEDNMPAVNAIKALMGIDDEQTNKQNVPSAGVTIRIVNVATQPQHEQTNKIPTRYLETETANEINNDHVITNNISDER
jgi:hypothetical protein